MSAPRLLLVGEFGCGNIGNDGTLTCFVDRLRRELPHAELRTLARDSAHVKQMLGLDGWDLYSRPMRGQAGKLVGRLGDVVRYARAVRWSDAVVVPGTGVLEGDLFSTALGTPYLVFLVGLLARLQRRPLALLCIGLSYQHTPLARRLTRWAGKLATYRSFRDSVSAREAIRVGSGQQGDHVAADLYFAHGVIEEISSERTVGLGLMTYFGAEPNASAQQRQQAWSAYTSAMADVVVGLLARNLPVRIYFGDAGDPAALEEVRVLLTERGVSQQLVTAPLPADASLAELAKSMAECQAIITPRYHNVVCAALAGRPTVGLAYGRKTAELIERLGLQQSSIPLETLQAVDVLDAYDALAADSVASARVRENAAGLAARSQAEIVRLAGFMRSTLTSADRPATPLRTGTKS